VSFKDHFSGHAADYAASRPTYPDELFRYLASLASSHQLAWDCATGNGQAALSLAGYFEKVLATDASSGQIAAATAHAAVEYRVATAESPGLDAASVDIVTVAQALHWFDIPGFFTTCAEVLKPSGLLAVWCYGQCTISPQLDSIVSNLYEETLGSYWPTERRLVEEQYRSIQFPLTRLTDVPQFAMRLTWTAQQLLDYLSSWSATRRYMQERGNDPIHAISTEVQSAWGDSLEKVVTWPLTLIVCRK
jgi:SAM-dependent methyltransferase